MGAVIVLYLLFGLWWKMPFFAVGRLGKTLATGQKTRSKSTAFDPNQESCSLLRNNFNILDDICGKYLCLKIHIVIILL